MNSAWGALRIFVFKAANVAVVVGLIVWFSAWAAQTQEADAAVQKQIQEAERAANQGPYATDGAFLGTAQGYGGPITVRATVENGYIEQLEIVSAENEDAPYLDQTRRLLTDVVNANTSAVDIVSGATFTSAGILNGATEALQKSNTGQAPDGEAS